jgi:hypothetical protein
VCVCVCVRACVCVRVCARPNSVSGFGMDVTEATEITCDVIEVLSLMGLRM